MQVAVPLVLLNDPAAQAEHVEVAVNDPSKPAYTVVASAEN